MKKGVTSLNQSEAIWWHTFRREAEMEAWKRLQRLFPRLADFDAPAGRVYGFKCQAETPKVGRYGRE